MKSILAAAGYNAEAGDDDNKQALKENIFYTGDEKAGTWTIKLDTAVLDVEAIEFLVAVRDDQGAQWGNNNYVAYPDDVKAFLYNVTLPVTSLTMSAANVDATTDEQFTMAVTAQGTVADADKEHKVRFYGVIPGLSAEDIDLAEIEGGTPEIVIDETERGYAGASEGDLVLAWGPDGGFPLKSYDYSQGVTTEFKATINKAGTYTVKFVFYDIDGQKRLNGEDETATITIKPTLAATISMVDPSEDVIGTVGWTRFAGSVEVAEGVKDINAYYIFEIEGENGLVEETVPQYWDYQAESWKDFAVEDGKYRFGGKDGFPLTKELPYEGQTEFQVKIDGESITGKAYLVDADTGAVISNIVEETIEADSAAVSIEDEEGTNVQMMQVPVIEEDCVEGEETSKEMGTETEVTTEDPAENGAEAIVDEEVEDGIDEKQLIEEEEIKTEVEDKEDVAEEEDAA